MRGEQSEGEGSGEESGLWDESPIYGPFPEELAGQLKGAGDIGRSSLAEGVAVGKLDKSDVMSDVNQYKRTETWTMIMACVMACVEPSA